MQITKGHEAVTLANNTAGEKTPILTLKTPDKLNYKLLDGTLLVMDLRETGGDKIAANSEFEISGKKPTYKNVREIDSNKPYRPYSALSVENQYNADNQALLKINIAPGFVDFIEGHELVILLKSDDVVDWTEDDTIIEFEVQEEAYRE